VTGGVSPQKADETQEGEGAKDNVGGEIGQVAQIEVE
jgi:hypothetical protein